MRCALNRRALQFLLGITLSTTTEFAARFPAAREEEGTRRREPAASPCDVRASSDAPAITRPSAADGRLGRSSRAGAESGSGGLVIGRFLIPHFMLTWRFHDGIASFLRWCGRLLLGIVGFLRNGEHRKVLRSWMTRARAVQPRGIASVSTLLAT